MTIIKKYIVKGADAEIHSDFDQNGKLEYVDKERKNRYLRPGAIILPNLNLSQGLPAGVPGIDLSTKRDADNDKIQGKPDLSDLTPLHVQSPFLNPLFADKLLLHVHNDNIPRFRVFLNDSGPPDSWMAVFGKGAGNNYYVPFKILSSWRKEFSLEALTLAGSPKAKGYNGASPIAPLDPPKSYNRLGKGITTEGSKNPIYTQVGPGEIWIELIHEAKGKKLENNYDVSLFQISPFILQSNLEECERIYVTYIKDNNHNFVYDLMEACWEAFKVRGKFDRDSSLDFKASTPADLSKPNSIIKEKNNISPSKLYLIDGTKYPDVWVQDEFEMGYCSAPGNRSFNVVVHCKRDRIDRMGVSHPAPLADFVKNELANKDIALFNDLEGTPQDGPDFGGNIEVTPPVSKKTKKEKKNNSGPAIPEHNIAPFGKIILGDFKNTDRTGNGLVHDETRDFFQAQVIQPIIPLNTSWLGVGHVDEFMSFVPSNTSRGSCLLIASVYMMNLLLNEIIKIKFEDGRTHFHRGKFEDNADLSTYAEISAEDLLKKDIGKYSQKIRKKFMTPIEGRLMRCSDHSKRDVIKVPIYFKPGNNISKPFGHEENITVAETVGMVNMQIAGDHLFVPKPFGPRMPKTLAENIIKNILKKIKRGGVAVKSLSDKGFTFWAWPGLDIEKVALFFAQPLKVSERKELIEKIKNPAYAISGALTTLVNSMKTHIINNNNSSPSPISSIIPGGIFNKWKRLIIPEKTVDIIETYMLSVLSDIGCKVHFVDDWDYHVGWGEAHCGTNAKRKPPSEANLAKKWWEIYDPSVDTKYDPKA